MKNAFIIVFTIATFFVNVPYAFSENLKFEGVGEYIMGDNDTISEAKKFALQEAKRLVLEKMGTYLQSQTEIKNYSVTRDEIVTYSQGIIKVKQLREKRFQVGTKSMGLRLHILAEVDSDDVISKLDSISGQSSLKNDIAEMKKEYDLLRKQIAQINDSLKKENDESKISFLREERKEILQKIENREEGISVLTSGQGLFKDALIQKKKFEESKTTVKRFFNELIRAYKIEAGKPSIEYEMNDKATITLEGKVTLPVSYGEYSQDNVLPIKSFKSIAGLGISFHGPFIRTNPIHKYFSCIPKQGDNRADLSAKYLRSKLSHLSIEASTGKHSISYRLPKIEGTHGYEGLYFERDFTIIFRSLPMSEVTKINKIDIKITCNQFCQKI